MNVIVNTAMIAVMVLAILPTWAVAQDGFVDHGVGANVAESRGVVVTQTEDGRSLVIANALDLGAISYLLVTDIDTGQTTQVWCPEDVRQSAPYGSLMHSNGKFYTTQGAIFLEFDPATLQWTFQGRGSPIGSAYIGFPEGPAGKVWAGSVYETGLISFDPTTRELVDHGRMDPEEKYLQSIAVDDTGWVYCGIGTARCNIVAYNPETGEKRLLIPEDKRATGSGSVVPSEDGKVYGAAAGMHFVLYEGNATPLESRAQAAANRGVYNIGRGQSTCTFPDGRKLTTYAMPDKWLMVENPATGETRRIEFEYDSGGAGISSLGEGPEGVVYGSTNHPMHFLKFDTNSRVLEDMGPIPQIGGGNLCAIASVGNLVIGASYAAGCLWAYDATKSWNPNPTAQAYGIRARELVEQGQCSDGHFSYLASYDVAFLCGDKFGAEGTFTLTAPDSGQYYLHIQPLQSERYCTVQFLLDGQELGEPYDAAANETRVANLLVFGPMELAAGEHRLTMRTLPTEGQEPWASVVAVELGKEKREQLTDTEEGANPVVLAQWKSDITRPRTAFVHPDGKHAMMAGFAAYGLAGGGIGIYNLETGEETLLTAEDDLLPSHSCITLKALPNGDLVGGTSISAPGGGHSTATEAELFIIDWPTKKLIFHTVPVPGQTEIVSIQTAENGLVYGLTGNSTFFVFDSTSRTVVHSERWTDYGGVPRHALHWGPDGNLYAMMSRAIVRITPGSFEHEKLADAPTNISAGGALVNGMLVFASNANVWSYQVPGL